MTEQLRRQLRYAGFASLALVPIAIVLAFFAVRMARVTQQREHRANCLKQIGSALQSFDDRYKRLPLAVHTDASGRPLSSWRFQLVPFLEAIMRDLDYQGRWDDPRNVWLTRRPSWVYCLPMEPVSTKSLHTNVVAITGPGTAFDGDKECRLCNLAPHTILAIEIVDSGIPWAAPGDLALEDVTQSILQGVDGKGVQVLFANGHVGLIPADMPLDDFKNLCTIKGAKKHDGKQVPGFQPSPQATRSPDNTGRPSP